MGEENMIVTPLAPCDIAHAQTAQSLSRLNVQ